MKTKQKGRKVVVGVLALAGLLAFSLLAIGGTLQPPAAPAPTMKTLDEVEPRVPIHASDLPLTITEPNSYYLVEDVNFTDDANHAITIESNDVTIDLMGYTLKGPDSGNKSGIYMDVRTNVEVRNGTVRDFGSGAIFALGSSSNSHRVINIRALSNRYGFVLYGWGHLVKDCTAAENGDKGIMSDVGSTVTGNISYNNNGLGIYAGTNSTVSGNTCNGNGNHGIQTGSACTVSDNSCYYNDQDGLSTNLGCTVTGNTCLGNLDDGIDTRYGCTVTGNTCYDNDNDGINVGRGSTVIGNTVCSNTGDGISVSLKCKVIDNTCYNNGYAGGSGAGIHAVSLQNRIEGNHVTDNDRGIDVDDVNNLIVKNSATGNTTEYDIVAGNKVGTISADPTIAGPWDNFDF
jgi:parallel beta-helix repeat protein